MTTKEAWWHPVLDHKRKRNKKNDQGLSWDSGQNEACYAEDKSLLQGKDMKIFHQNLFTGGDWVHVPNIYKTITIEFQTKVFQNISNTERNHFIAKSE